MPDLNEHSDTWINRVLTDALGHKIGKIEDVYTDDDTGRPEWLAVTTGLLGANTHFVPMRGATVSGGGVQVPFPRDQVKVAPCAGAGGRLSRMEKGRLYAHYGFSYAEERNRLQRSLSKDLPGRRRPPDRGEVSRSMAPDERSGPAGQGEASRPATGVEEADRPPPAAPGEGRGRWPDDEAIFGLTQVTADPAVAAGGPRGRG